MSNAFDTYEKITEIDAPAEAVYQWHTRPGAVARLVPPWSGIRLIEAPATLVEETPPRNGRQRAGVRGSCFGGLAAREGHHVDSGNGWER